MDYTLAVSGLVEPLTGSADLWLALWTGAHIVLGGPTAPTTPEEGTMEEGDPMAGVFAALTAGLTDEQILLLRRLVTAHMSFLAGLIQASTNGD